MILALMTWPAAGRSFEALAGFPLCFCARVWGGKSLKKCLSLDSVCTAVRILLHSHSTMRAAPAAMYLALKELRPDSNPTPGTLP